MVLSIISIIANITFNIIIFLKLFTARVHMPDGGLSIYHLSALDKLNAADLTILVYLQILISMVAVILSIFVLGKVKADIMKKPQIISFIASVVMFIVLMIVTILIHPKY